MEESQPDMKDWSPVMQRLELLKSQLESNDEVIHEMERSLKAKTPSNEIDEPVDEIEHLKRTVSSLEEKVANAETTIYNLEEEIEEKNKLIEARTMVISVLQRDVEAKRVATNSMFEKTQQEIQNMHENFMAFKENMAVENKKLLDQLDSSRQRYRKLDLRLQETEKEKGALIQINDDLNFQIENIMALNNELKMKVVELTENVDSPKQKIRELTDELESVKQEFKKTVLNLELKIAHYEGECEKVKKSSQENQQLLEGEVAKLKEENNSLASKISNFESEISCLENGKKQKETTLLALVEEKELLISEMKQKVKHFHSERDELIKRLTQAENSLKSKESKFEKVKAEVVELRSALEAMKNSGSNEDMACSLNNEINLLQDELCKSKNDFQQEKQRVHMLTETIDELEEKIQDSDLLLLEEKQNTINIKKELDQLKQQFSEKEEELAREKGSATQLQENFYHVLNELEQYKQHFGQNSSEMFEIQQKLSSAEEEKSRLETVISSLLRDVISLTAKSTETEINFEKENHLYVVLQEKFLELSTMFTQTTADVKNKHDIIVNLQEERDKLLKTKEDAIASLRAEYDHFLRSKENLIVNLQTELESLKQNEEDRVSVRDMEAYIAQQDEMIKELTKNVQIKAEEANHLAASCEELQRRLNEYATYTTGELGNKDRNLQSSLEGGNSIVELQTLQARVSYLEQMLMEANSNLEQQISKLRMVENENETLKSKISELSADSKSSELMRILSDNEEKLAEKTKSLDQLSTQYNELLSKFNEMVNHSSAVQAELMNKDLTIKNLETYTEAIQNESGEKMQELNTCVDEKECAYLELKSKYDLMNSQLMEIQQNLESKVELCNKLQAQIESISSENAKLANYEIQCSELLRQIEVLQTSQSQRHSEVEHEMLQVTNITEHLTDENNKLLNQVIELSDQVKHNEVERITLTDELSNLKESLKELKNENSVLKEEISTSSKLRTQVHDLERLIDEKDRLITEIQFKTSVDEECVQKLEKPIESGNAVKNSVSSSFESNDISGSLLPLAQEYLRINYQLLALKDLLEDLVTCEMGELSHESDLKLMLEGLENDLQESEVALKTYESKLRKSPSASGDSLESSVLALRSYVDQIGKQISTCGEVLKDWVLSKTPPKKSVFGVETQTDFSVESKPSSRLNSENLDDWNWGAENNEDSEVKIDDDSLLYGFVGKQNEIQSVETNKVVLNEIDDVHSSSELNISFTPVNSVDPLAANPSVTVDGHTSEVVFSESSESQLIIPHTLENRVTQDPEERLRGKQDLDLALQKHASQHAPSDFENYPIPANHGQPQDYSHEHTSSHEGHVCDHEHTHGHSHDHGHEHDHQHLHESHDHNHEHNHQHSHGSHDENNRLVQVSYENDKNLAESELPDHSHSDEEGYGGGYLQENQLIVVNKAHVEDMKVKLDSVLYKLHEKDVQNNELTRELIELLKERDILQLKLSSAYRLLASQEKETTDTNGTPNSIKNEELISKINELDSLSGWHDPMVKVEHEQKNMQVLYSNQALPRPQKENHSTETESDSAIYNLFNWITGSR